MHGQFGEDICGISECDMKCCCNAIIIILLQQSFSIACGCDIMARVLHYYWVNFDFMGLARAGNSNCVQR
jgi:hypothetical protein